MCIICDALVFHILFSQLSKVSHPCHKMCILGLPSSLKFLEENTSISLCNDGTSRVKGPIGKESTSFSN